MSQENKKEGHLQNCEITPDSIPECSILVTDSSLNVPLQKRKEEAKNSILKQDLSLEDCFFSRILNCT